MSVFLLSCCLGVVPIAQTPQLHQQSDADGIYYSGYATAHKENCSNDWKIGGKIHFEEGSSSGYVGTIAINELTRKIIKKYFDIQIDSCASNAKVLLKKESNQIILTHREERSIPGIGEELHATLLYTSKRVERGHETLHDIYNNLRQVDESLPQDRAPTIEQVADAYQKFIKPDWQFQISDVQLISNTTGSFIIARLELNGQDEIQNSQGSPISGNFLHLTLAMIESSISEIEKIQLVVSELKTALAGKTVKIGNRNGYVDLEFGVSGSSTRIRPAFEQKDVVIRSNQEKFSALRGFQLPIDQYAITGSGPLGIRNLKAIGDIDIIIIPKLWTTLAEKYGVTDENGVRKIVLPGGVVEAFADGSFYTAPADPQAPTIASRIKDAEIIDGLPFDSIENVLYYKHKDAREKDLKDILLIEQWIRIQKS